MKWNTHYVATESLSDFMAMLVREGGTVTQAESTDDGVIVTWISRPRILANAH